MGHSIVYCDKCGQRLKEEDFRRGRASIADNRNYCESCRPAGSSSVLPKVPGPRSSSTRIPQQPAAGKISSSKIPKQSAQDSRHLPGVPSPAPTVAPTPTGPGSRRWWVAGGAAGAVLIAVLAWLFAGRPEHRPRGDAKSMQEVISVPPPPSDRVPSESRPQEALARAACVKAYEVQTTRPRDLTSQWRAFEAALAASRGTSYAPEAEAQLGKLRRKFEDDRKELEVRTQDALSREQLRSALELWQGELMRYDVPEWTQAISRRIEELKADFERRWGAMRDLAVEAKRRGDEPEVQKVRAQISGWGLGGYAQRVDAALSVVVAVKSEPAPDVGKSSALEAYRSRWQEVLGLAAGRDFAQAIQALEKVAGETKDPAVKGEAADDLENFRLAASLVQESGALLEKLPKGQKAALAYWDPAGRLVRTEDVVLKVDPQRLEVKTEEGSRVIPFGDMASSTLADLFRSRPAKKDTDARAEVVACLLDGDTEGAQRFRAGSLPATLDKYGEAAKELLGRRSGDENEKAARRIFYDAERGYFDYAQMPEAVARYKSLLAEHAQTEFVRRNRAAIAARTEPPFKDFHYATGDLTVAPTFKLVKLPKVDQAWVSQQDLDPARTRENFVEMEFSAGTDTDYHCWILAGGCCQEVLTCYCQATELTGPDPANPKERISLEPGSGSGLLVKSTHSSLKRLHSQHNGPKNPEHFDWELVGVFKFATAGIKRIRILSNQKGFSVAWAAVLATRPGPPRGSEIKEFEKWRQETPGASLKQGGAGTGSILREVWNDIAGVNVSDLTGQKAFQEDRPTERSLLAIFEGPTNIGDNYGTRIRGYLYPPLTGAYVFWIASDDQGELFLSSDEDPAHKKRIAVSPSWTNPREWGKFPEQQSQPILLQAGSRYYIEALHKEGGGGDHVSVGWQLPNGTQERPIPGNRLSPVVLPGK